MSKIVDIKFEKIPEMCCDSHENYFKSTSNGYTGTLISAFFPAKLWAFHMQSLANLVVCTNLNFLLPEYEEKKFENFLSFF